MISKKSGTSLAGPVAKISGAPSAGSGGSIPGQGTRSHSHKSKSSHTATKDLAYSNED